MSTNTLIRVYNTLIKADCEAIRCEDYTSGRIIRTLIAGMLPATGGPVTRLVVAGEEIGRIARAAEGDPSPEYVIRYALAADVARRHRDDVDPIVLGILGGLASGDGGTAWCAIGWGAPREAYDNGRKAGFLIALACGGGDE